VPPTRIRSAHYEARIVNVHVWNPANLAYLGWADSTGSVISVPGDWNGDGKTEMGVYCKGVWFRDTAGTGQWDGGWA
jgi:hypothetical protein